MVDAETFRHMALSFPGITEQPHYEKTSFRIGKKIFATLDVEKNQACIKLNEVDQDVFSAFDRSVIYPVPNKWGKQGWTLIKLPDVRKDLLTEALSTAYSELASQPAITKKNNKPEEGQTF